jgi:hypothetical protein
MKYQISVMALLAATFPQGQTYSLSQLAQIPLNEINFDELLAQTSEAMLNSEVGSQDTLNTDVSEEAIVVDSTGETVIDDGSVENGSVDVVSTNATVEDVAIEVEDNTGTYGVTTTDLLASGGINPFEVVIVDDEIGLQVYGSQEIIGGESVMVINEDSVGDNGTTTIIDDADTQNGTVEIDDGEIDADDIGEYLFVNDTQLDVDQEELVFTDTGVNIQPIGTEEETDIVVILDDEIAENYEEVI